MTRSCSVPLNVSAGEQIRVRESDRLKHNSHKWKKGKPKKKSWGNQEEGKRKESTRPGGLDGVGGHRCARPMVVHAPGGKRSTTFFCEHNDGFMSLESDFFECSFVGKLQTESCFFSLASLKCMCRCFVACGVLWLRNSLLRR
jgi:hypothetical protein